MLQDSYIKMLYFFSKKFVSPYSYVKVLIIYKISTLEIQATNAC